MSRVRVGGAARAASLVVVLLLVGCVLSALPSIHCYDWRLPPPPPDPLSSPDSGVLRLTLSASKLSLVRGGGPAKLLCTITRPLGTDESVSVIVEPAVGGLIVGSLVIPPGASTGELLIEAGMGAAIGTSMTSVIGSIGSTPTSPQQRDHDRTPAVPLEISIVDSGNLDPTFGPGGGGVVTTEIGTKSGAFALALSVLTPNNDVLVAGNAPKTMPVGTDFVMARYDSAGVLDATFGQGGKTSVAFSGAILSSAAFDASRNAVLAVGTYPDPDLGTYFVMQRFKLDGSADPSFMGGAGQGVGQAVLPQPDGKLLAAGYTLNASGQPAEFLLLRTAADGGLDTSFADAGRLSPSVGATTSIAYAVVLQSDGKIIVGGSTARVGSTGGGTDLALVRVNTDGSLDTSFNPSGTPPGIVRTDAGPTAVVYALAVQPDGKIVATGSGSAGLTTDVAVVRYNSDGSLDTAFGTGGRVFLAGIGQRTTANAVTLQPDGKIVVAGYRRVPPNNHDDFLVARFTSDGALDPVFGRGGITVTPFAAGAVSVAHALALAADGRIVVAGHVVVNGSTPAFALARYLP